MICPAQNQASAGCAAAQYVRSPGPRPGKHFSGVSGHGHCLLQYACYNMLDPKSSMLKNVLFSGSYQSYNERVIGLTKHCLS